MLQIRELEFRERHGLADALHHSGAEPGLELRTVPWALHPLVTPRAGGWGSACQALEQSYLPLETKATFGLC